MIPTGIWTHRIFWYAFLFDPALDLPFLNFIASYRERKHGLVRFLIDPSLSFPDDCLHILWSNILAYAPFGENAFVLSNPGV